MLRSLKLSYERLFSKYQLTKKAMRKSIEIARSYILKEIKWQDVIFSDEKIFTLTCSDSFYTWKQKGTNFYRKITSFVHLV